MASRRNTVYPPNNISEPSLRDFTLSRRSRYGAAAATLLGGELGEQLNDRDTKDDRGRGEVDVEVLLRGAEKLCAV